MSKRKPIRTDIAWSTPSSITVGGLDLCRDILGTVSLGDMAFLQLTACRRSGNRPCSTHSQ